MTGAFSTILVFVVLVVASEAQLDAAQAAAFVDLCNFADFAVSIGLNDQSECKSLTPSSICTLSPYIVLCDVDDLNINYLCVPLIWFSVAECRSLQSVQLTEIPPMLASFTSMTTLYSLFSRGGLRVISPGT